MHHEIQLSYLQVKPTGNETDTVGQRDICIHILIVTLLATD